ncbi:MAG TPA: metal ABC transporter substrate-binding protein [Xanthobacteraceae bacterium]|nr:metal ABC transporter substrate-binding protein [Xanthobacteraceae bacterium]
MLTRRSLAAALLVSLPFALAEAQAAEKIKVVTSFSILADLVRQVGGERLEVTALVGPDTDMHVFQPAPQDAKMLLGADLVVLNGLGFEGWADRLVKASGYDGQTVVAAQGINLPGANESKNGSGHKHGPDKGYRHGPAHVHGKHDPHAWQDVANVKIYVANIRDALIATDAAGRAQYEAAASRYIAALDALDAEIKSAFAGLSRAERRVITSHDAFAYYGRAYGIEFLAPQGLGEAEATAKGVAGLIRQIKRERVKAVFVENISNPRLIERIAKETGVKLGGTLYSDALSAADGPAPTYIDMMRHNTRLLAAAMR